MNISTINNAVLGTDESVLSSKAPSSQAPVKTTTAVEKPLRERTSEKTKEKAPMEETRKMADELNEIMADMGTNLGFYIREDMNNQVVVEIKNKKTDEVIKQIPSEEMLKIMKKMEELTGLIFDQRI